MIIQWYDQELKKKENHSELDQQSKNRGGNSDPPRKNRVLRIVSSETVYAYIDDQGFVYAIAGSIKSDYTLSITFEQIINNYSKTALTDIKS